MKHSFLLNVLFLFFSLPIFTATRNSNLESSSKQKNTLFFRDRSEQISSTSNNVTSDPFEEDTKTDIALFNHFIKILANFGHILLDPHNPANVTLNAAKMIDSVVAVAQELTKRGNPTDKQMRKMVRLILLALQRQGFLPSKPNTITSFGYSIS